MAARTDGHRILVAQTPWVSIKLRSRAPTRGHWPPNHFVAPLRGAPMHIFDMKLDDVTERTSAYGSAWRWLPACDRYCTQYLAPIPPCPCGGNPFKEIANRAHHKRQGRVGAERRLHSIASSRRSFLQACPGQPDPSEWRRSIAGRQSKMIDLHEDVSRDLVRGGSAMLEEARAGRFAGKAVTPTRCESAEMRPILCGVPP